MLLYSIHIISQRCCGGRIRSPGRDGVACTSRSSSDSNPKIKNFEIQNFCKIFSISKFLRHVSCEEDNLSNKNILVMFCPGSVLFFNEMD